MDKQPTERDGTRLCFLFGSGVSIPAGYPTVSRITEDILAGKKLNSPPIIPVAEETIAFARWLKTIADARYIRESGRIANYEDIFFLASQIHDDCLYEFENPALAPLMDKAIIEFLSGTECQSMSGSDRLNGFAADIIKHIRCSVVSALSNHEKPSRMDHLNFVAEAINDVRAANVCVLTVNHDNLLEEFFGAQKIPYTDGFVKQPDTVGIRKWQPLLLSEGCGGVSVLKLHGGINWNRFRPNGAKPWIEDYVGIRERCDPNIRDEQRRTHDPLDETIFLIGTFNKLSSYTDPVFLELYYRAFHALKCADILVIVGYGFGDKGINKLITEWLCRSRDHRIVVIDKNCECKVSEQARGAIRNKWKDREIGERFCFIKRDLSDKVSWREIRKKINLSDDI